MIRRFRSGGTAWRSKLAAWLAVAVMMVATIIGVAQTARAAAGGSTLSAGQVLQPGQDLVSPGGQYTLVMQDDGNLVTYGNGCVIWASNTAGVGSSDYLVMQDDGNLVIYTSAGKPVWASNTAGIGSSDYLAMQGDGNLVIYTSAGKPVWASGAGNADQLCAPHSMGLDQYIHSSGGQYRLLMQDDGNLVLYGPNGATWASNTVGSGGTSVNMQGDGNLVIYTSAAKPVWASNTAGTGSANHLVMQDDGNLVIYTSSGKPVWASKTAVTSSSGGGSGAPSVRLCNGWAGCSTNGYTTHGYQNHEWTSYWGMAAGNQCTNYAAYVESTIYGKPRPGYTLGNAGTWAQNARAHGVTVNQTPTVGAVAEWNGGDYGMTAYGHVAVVEQVGPNGSYIVISQQNITTDTNGYDWTKIYAGGPTNRWEEWPDNFIHF